MVMETPPCFLKRVPAGHRHASRRMAPPTAMRSPSQVQRGAVAACVGEPARKGAVGTVSPRAR
jgi:hypothetical protein